MINRRNGLWAVGAVFMVIGIARMASDTGGSAVWIALGAVFIALGGAAARKGGGGNGPR